jgi:hypothetical protein
VAPPSPEWPDALAQSKDFCSTRTRVYESQRTLGSVEWVALVTTFSDHQRLEPQRLGALQRALADAIEDLGGAVHVRGGTYVLLVRRA